MPDSDFIQRDLRRFERRLLASGIKPRYAARARSELYDHIQDIEAEAVAQGAGAAGARAAALDGIGDFSAIAGEIIQCRDLKTWPYRYPRIARVWFPFAYATLLPVTPIIAGIERAPQIARWAACAMLGAAVTATMLLVLQLSILFA